MGGDAMYYGLNALSNNMILLDRKQSRCPNGLVFGTPGSGKSMSCKREITFIMLMTQDNVIICDPEDEYSPLVKRLGGQVIRLSPSSTDYVNPLDINLNYSEEENPLALKSDFVLSFCELIMGSKTGLEAIEKNGHRPGGADDLPALLCRPPAGEYADSGRPDELPSVPAYPGG